MSGFLGHAANAVGSVNAVARGVSGLVQGVGNLLGLDLGPLEQASWRGIPFAVRTTRLHNGRRTALHEYPFRDDVWIEDLGQLPDTFSIEGFLIGDDPVAMDVLDQRDQMLSALDQSGPGTLVLPSYGAINAVLVDSSIGESFETRGAIDLSLTFVRSRQQQQPRSVPNTSGILGTIANAIGLGGVADFVTQAASFVQAGVGIVTQVAATVTRFIGQVEGLAGDAAILTSAVDSVFGNPTRYRGVPLAGIPVPATPLAAVIATTAARATVASAGQTAGQVAVQFTATTAGTLGASLTVLTEALRMVCVNPADAIRLLTVAAGFQPVSASAADVAVSNMARRAAIASLALAAQAYTPSSSDEAIVIRDAVSGIMMTEIEVAADAGDTQSYTALLQANAAIVQDYTERAGQLARVITITRKASLPAFRLAHDLYDDATRVDDLVKRIDVPHPAFMPLTMNVLSA